MKDLLKKTGNKKAEATPLYVAHDLDDEWSIRTTTSTTTTTATTTTTTTTWYISEIKSTDDSDDLMDEWSITTRTSTTTSTTTTK